MLRFLTTEEDLDMKKINEIKPFSLLNNKRIGWNYYMDYVFVAKKFEKRYEKNKHKNIIDVGAGPGAIHGYLEKKYNIDICGLDLKRWEKGDYVDETENILEKDFGSTKFDAIISTSAFEHQSFEDHRKCIDKCKSLLSEKGFLIVTTVGHKKSFKRGNQWICGAKRLEKIYEEEMSNKEKFDEIVEKYKSNEILYKEYKKRFGVRNIDLLKNPLRYLKNKLKDFYLSVGYVL